MLHRYNVALATRNLRHTRPHETIPIPVIYLTSSILLGLRLCFVFHDHIVLVFIRPTHICCSTLGFLWWPLVAVFI